MRETTSEPKVSRRTPAQVSSTAKRPGSRDERLADIVREGVLSQILDGRLRPGEMISASELARTYGTSKMPVREALTALTRDGLMESIPYKGFVVRTIDVHDVEEVNFVRELLECASTGLAVDHITQKELRRLRTLEEQDIEFLHRAAVGLERDLTSVTFHSVIAEASRNQRLALMIKQLLQHVNRIQYAALTVRQIEENHREHLVLIAALEERDFDASVDGMRIHLQNIERRGREALVGMRRAARLPAPGRSAAGRASKSGPEAPEDRREPSSALDEQVRT